MPSEANNTKQPPQHRKPADGAQSGTGTEASRQGGVEPAKRQAERDWQDSAKESGD